MTWADWEREHPLDFICPFCPFNLPNLRHSIEDHFKAHHPDKNPWANPYEQEEQDDSQSPASSQPSSQSDMFASQETKSKAIAESTRLDDRSQMQSTHVLEAVSLSPVVAQQEQEEMEAEEEMPTLAEATTQQLEQIPGGLYHKRLRDDKRAREEEERKRKGEESPEERSPGLTAFPDNWDASSPGISATSMSWDPSAEVEQESQSCLEDLGEEYRRFGHLVLRNHPMSLSQDEEGASGHNDSKSSCASSASTGEVLRRSLQIEELEDLEEAAKEFLEEAQKTSQRTKKEETEANVPDPHARVKAKRQLFLTPGGINEPQKSNTERVGEDVTKGEVANVDNVADTIEEADNMADGDNIKLYSSEEESDNETFERDQEEKVGHPGVRPESLKDQAPAPALPPSNLDPLSPTIVEVAPESAPAPPLVATATGPGKPPNCQQDAQSKKDGDDEGALTGKEGEEGETVAASQENEHDERDQEEKVGHPGVGPLKDQATAPASPSSKLDLLSPTIVDAMKGIEELAQQNEEAEKQAAKLKKEIQDKIRKFGGISNVKKFYRMLIEKAWEEAETTKDARIMAAAKKEISKAVMILEVIEKAATGTTSSEKTVTEKTTTEEFPDEKPPDEELATEKPDVGVKGEDEKTAEVVGKDSIEEPLPTPPPLVVESLSDPMLATDDLEEPQPPPEAPAHLPGADDHQDVEQKQDLPAQEQEKEPIENPTTPPNTAALEKPQDLAENKTAAPTGPPVLDKVASLPSQPLLVVESLSDPILATDDLEEPQPPPVLEARAHLSGAEDHQDVDQGQDLPAQGLNVDDDRDEVNAKRVQDGAGEVRVPPPLHPVEPALPYQPGDDPFSPLSNFPCGHTKRYIYSSANL